MKNEKLMKIGSSSGAKAFFFFQGDAFHCIHAAAIKNDVN